MLGDRRQPPPACERLSLNPQPLHLRSNTSRKDEFSLGLISTDQFPLLDRLFRTVPGFIGKLLGNRRRNVKTKLALVPEQNGQG